MKVNILYVIIKQIPSTTVKERTKSMEAEKQEAIVSQKSINKVEAPEQDKRKILSLGLTRSPEGRWQDIENSHKVESWHFHCIVCQALSKQFTYILSNLHTLTHLILKNSIMKNCYYPHLTDRN